jgi:putative phosphoesterase
VSRRVRIGVVADTHVGEHLPVLPPEIPEVLAGVDLILHAGDLTDTVVLDALGRIAEVVAVRGNHDEDGGIGHLPRDVLVRAGGARIGLTHGHRTAAVEFPAAALSLVAGRPVLIGFGTAMRKRFGSVDCLVTGHLHLPIHRRVGGALLFSPGAVFLPERDPHYDWAGARGRGYRRFRMGLPAEAHTPAVGILEVDGGHVSARRIPLERPVTGEGS